MEKSKRQPQNANWRQGKNVGACMREMFDRGLWTDVEFQCKDHDAKGIIKAHKIVLAARSPVFEAMFFGPCADGKSVVEVKNTDSEIFQAFLRYIYSDTVNITEEKVFSLIETAHCYQVSCLVEYCADFLCKILSPINVCGILTHAILYELVSLRDVCCSFIDNNVEVLKSDGFLNVSESVLLYILKGDTLYTEEENIIEAVEKWSRKKLDEKGLEQNSANIRKRLGQAFYQLRIPTLTNKSLVESISRRGYFSIEEYSDIAAFINNVDGINVATNSCVARITERESIVVGSEDVTEEIYNTISTSFGISVTKDVALETITLNTVRPYLQVLKTLYTKSESTITSTYSSSENVSLDNYGNSILQITQKPLTEEGKIKLELLGLRNFKQYNINILRVDPYKGNPLPENMNLTLSGCVQIKTLKLKKEFEIQQQQNNEIKINLDPSFVLKKSQTPYGVDMTLRYKCGNGIQVQTKGTARNLTYANKDGTITIQTDKSSRLVGIKRLDFQNFSNRDIKNHSQPTRVMTNVHVSGRHVITMGGHKKY